MATLTQHLAKSAKGKEKPYEIRDGGNKSVRGLLLRVQPSGSKTYYLEFARGKRVRIGTSDLTLTRARDLASKAKAGVIDGKDPRKHSKPITLGKFLSDVYAPYFRTHHRSDASLGNLAALKPLYAKRLSDLSLSSVKRWREDRIKIGRSTATINRNVTALKTALKYAVEEGYLDDNPIQALSVLKVEHPNRVRFLTEDEETRLRDALDVRDSKIRSERESGNAWRRERDYELLPSMSNLPYADHLKPMILLTMNTGLRRGELFDLRWISVVEDSLTVQQSKSGKARHIPLNRDAKSILEGWRAAGTKNWIFENNERPFNNVNKAWRKLLADAEIDNFRWHDLRHHFASMLVMGGRARDATGSTKKKKEQDRIKKHRERAVPLNTVRELLGHSDIKMTLRYAHLAPGHMRDAVEALNL